MIYQNNSFWHQTTSYRNLNTKNISGKKFDVLIIGAGLSGLNTAFLLMNKGLNIGIIDSTHIGYGVSGYSNAKITIQHNLIYDYLIRNFGISTAKNYYKANLDGLNFYKNIIYNLNIPCDFQEDFSVVYSKYNEKVYDLKSEKEAYDAIGIKSNIIDIYSMNFPISCGLEVPNQYKFNPLKYLYSLANILNKNNIDIYENTKAIDVCLNENPHKIITNNGDVFANKVIIATHFPLKKLLGLFFIKQSQEKSYIIACKTNTKPFDGMYINIDKNIRSIRFQKNIKDSILLLGGCNHPVGKPNNEENAYKKLEDFLIKYFSKHDILAKWSTQDCMSHDRIPFIGPISKLYKDIYVATGFSKWGMTNSAASAIIISNMILNNNITYYENIFNPYRHLNINATSVFKIGKASYNTLIGYSKKLLLRSKKEVLDLKNGDGTIINSGITNIGVFLDDEDNFHCIKPVCTHLGCSLEFNTEDKTWDCQCHGSRFDILGHVIEGPATKSLKYAKIKRSDIL
ncbi:FAD-dependent oxidoreductase [Sedimentibacter sp. zth1]|uniref:FAD-dependent oxidoreductase n=1 Tax=Sedimentibacter sp. zth1 TaxID=2816908 RepID=UPI001A92899C|nr:FAD-dependent oxidoreductase [Sedimentibacter sp. zth1]QSX04709.1 FAD-dependent oxidoreductase [Sedimentibacter sp. zth1]